MKIPRGISYNGLILEYSQMVLFAIEFCFTWFMKNQYNQKDYPDDIFISKQKCNKDLITKLSHGNVK